MSNEKNIVIAMSFEELTKKIVNKKKVEQLEIDFPVISHRENGELIHQRITDGYINATAICKACDKSFSDYRRLTTTDAFLSALSRSMGIPIDRLSQTILNVPNELKGTWVHPKVAIHLAQWASPEFAVAVSEWVFDWVSGNNKKYKLPPHIERYMLNQHKIPVTHFSMLNEMTFALIAPLEKSGYTLGSQLMPDISEGKVFCNFLRKEMGIEPKDFKTYKHEFPDGRVCDAKLYPNSLLATFREHFYEKWIPNYSIKYFSEKAPEAVPHLQQIILNLPLMELNGIK